MQKAIASLADRLEVLETQDTPGKPLAAAPDAAEREDEDMLAAFSAAVSSVEAGVEVAELPKAVGDDDGFTPGLPEWAAPQDTEADEDYTPGLPAEVIEPKGKQASADPLAELGQWETPELQGDESEDIDGTIFDTVLPAREPEERITIPPAHLDLDVDMPRAALSPSAADKADEAEAAQPEPEAETPSGELEEDLDASDYIARARKAALAAAQGQASEDSAASSRLGGRVPLYAAASVIVLAAAGTSGYLYLRGKQSPAGPVSAAVTTPATPTLTAGGAGGGKPPTLNTATSGTGDAAAGLAAVAAAAGLDAPGTDITGAVESAPSDTVESAAAGVLPEPTMTAPQPAITPEPEPQPVALPERANFDPIPAPLTLQSAADSGDRVAAYQLGVRKLDSADYAEGARYISASAQKGLPIAQYRLSKLHEKGLGVPRDLAASRRWTERAANGGNVRAMHDLAVFYADGEGGEQSYAKSVEWFSKAAEFGVLDSQYNLAVLYQQGLGITKDLNEALFWFSVAAENGDPGAADQVRAMLTEVDADAALTVRARVQGWRGARPNGPANG
ncbi:MAG: tetratricopeptide repeat protein, partial [Pseudomonadota bacterium]